MDIYEYISGNAPSQCHAIFQKYGFEAVAPNPGDMADCLEQLVGEVGEPAMRDIVLLHPDRELIIETFASNAPAMQTPPTGGCGCSKCKGAGPVAEKYIHQAQGQQGNDMHQAGLFIIGGLLVITLAIISQKS